MARTPDDEYQRALDGLYEQVEDGRVAEQDAEAIERMCFAFDGEDARESLPTDMYESRRAEHVTASTRRAWVTRLRHVAQEVPLTDADADDINTITTRWVKSDGPPATTTIQNREHALTKFYRFHDDLGVDPGEIVNHSGDAPGWDDRDLLDAEERAALRAVCDHPRDRALLHLALYCGLRNTALRTLRVKDIDLEEDEFYFNTEADGLKDIHNPNAPRPLHQAEKAVRDWLDRHPDPRDENPLLCAKPGSRITDYSDPISRESVRYALTSLKDRTKCPHCRGSAAGGGDCVRCEGTGDAADVPTVEKPLHPHMLRHNFVTMCRRHPDITDGAIKFFIGHSEGSDVMQTTYSHLSSDDHNEAGHSAFGVSGAGDDGDGPPPWDATCEQCDAVLAPGDDVCEGCGADRGTTPWDDDIPVDSEYDPLREAVREEVTDMVLPAVARMTGQTDQGLVPPPDRDDDMTTEERTEEIREKLGLED
jgi:integrase